MKYITIVPFLLLLQYPSVAAQNVIWVHVEAGTALFLNPKTMDWEPIVGKQQVPIKTYVMTKDETVLNIFKETDVLPAPANGFFFLGDLFFRDRMKVVEELTSIETQQLPSSMKSDTTEHKKIVGLTYGVLQSHTSNPSSIPYLKERCNTIDWFYTHSRFDAALLSLKRMMIQFPVLYLDPNLTEILCKLYDKLELYGFLYEETNRLMIVQKDGEFGTMITRWNDIAKKKITRR